MEKKQAQGKLRQAHYRWGKQNLWWKGSNDVHLPKMKGDEIVTSNEKLLVTMRILDEREK